MGLSELLAALTLLSACGESERSAGAQPRCDTTLAHQYYPDADGDGYVGSTDAVCATSAPAGYRPALTAPDCDDADAARHPDAWESFGDGIDSDCSGEDDPRVCTAEARAVLDTPPERDVCEQADLKLVAATLCRPCHGGPGQIVLRALNQGSERSLETTLVLGVDGEPTGEVLVPPLEPGEGSEPFALVATNSVEATLMASDCDGSNDALVADVVSESCTR